MIGPNYPIAMSQIMHVAVRQRLLEISAQLAQICSWTVQSGPFRGMRLPSTATSWGDGDLAPKLLGCYEAELHEAIEHAIARKPDVVVNVGCAEGYYAIGLAQRLPDARVYAFDIDPAAQALCAAAGAENGVGDRLIVEGECDGPRLAELAGAGDRVLILMDCEGAELQLLDAKTVSALAGCDVIVECHDFIDRTITPGLTALLGENHDLGSLREGPRDPAQFPVLKSLGSLERWICVCEFRPEVMNWITSWSRRAH
jgi:hypothetical protein